MKKTDVLSVVSQVQCFPTDKLTKNVHGPQTSTCVVLSSLRGDSRSPRDENLGAVRQVHADVVVMVSCFRPTHGTPF